MRPIPFPPAAFNTPRANLTMRQITRNRFESLLAKHSPPCLSLYQPTHRTHPDNKQDPILFRNQIDELRRKLAQTYSKHEVDEAMQPLESLLDDAEFWNRRTESMAVLSAPGVFEVFDLLRPVEPFIGVAENFYVKPLLRILQSSDRYQVLSISRGEVKLYEGNRDVLDEAVLHGVAANPRTGAGRSAGQGFSASHEEDAELERYLREVDRAVLEGHSRPTGLPLLLAGLPEQQTLFRSISINPLLVGEAGIRVNADTLSLDELRRQAWELVQPHYLARLAGLVESFGLENSRGKGSDEVTTVARAAADGRVAMLLLEADRKLPGIIDPETGAMQVDGLAPAETSDVLDDVAEAVIRAGGEVVIVPAERMPTGTGLAATFRF
jgi:hypothetical protein